MQIRYFAVWLLLSFLGAGCSSQKVSFNPSSLVPAADATATISRDQNDNARILVEVKHLADPQRLDPPKEVYVVWAETRQGRTLNLGQLTVDTDRNGKLETTTSLKEFRLIISAETTSSSTASSPGRQVLVTTDFFSVD